MAEDAAEVRAEDDDYAGLDPNVLCRLTLLPRWTEKLAEQLELTRPESLSLLMERLRRTNLVVSGLDDRTLSSDGPPQRLFWVREWRRRDVGDHVRNLLGGAVHQAYAALCEQVAKGEPDQSLRLWLEVKDFHDDPSGRELMNRIEGLLRDGALADAQKTVATAEVVGDVVGGSLDMSVRRAQWRLNRQYRDDDDVRHLRNYFRRAEIEGALRDLVTSAEESSNWALHLRGDAGAGKTMALRYLGSSRFAEDHGIPSFPVARVDFDHLDPRYPEQRPMELLIALSDQLMRFAPSRVTEHANEEVHRTSDRLATAIAGQEGLTEREKADLLAKGVDQFARLAEAMGAPVVLVLDTCEEIGKLYAPGMDAPAIDRTFDLLEQLHEAAPCIRVVFAGRRPLAPSTKDCQDGPNLKERPYLTVVPIRGFTEAEAREFVARRKVPDHLVDAIIARTAIGRSGRHIPFELDGYSSWAREDTHLTAEALLNSSADPYVERRIVGRIHDQAVLKAIPVAVAYERFDLALISRALKRLGVDPLEAFDGLAGQEWTVTLATVDGRPSVIEVSEHLRDRLRSFFPVLPDPAELGRDAAALLAASPLEALTAETVEAAIRLLPVAEAAQVWREVDKRILTEDGWAWYRQIADRLCDVARSRTGESAFASLRATQACAITRSSGRARSRYLWEEVLKHAGHHPNREERTILTLRARLGHIAGGGPIVTQRDENVLADAVAPEVPFTELAAEALNRGLADSVLAAIDTVVVATGPVKAAPLVDTPLTFLSDHSHPMIAAHARVLLSALVLARGRADADQMAAALRSVEEAGRPPALPDWTPPPGLIHRARSLLLHSALRGGAPVSAELADRWRDDALQLGENDVDADRLLAAVTDYELTRGTRSAAIESQPSTVHSDAVLWMHFALGRPFVLAVADVLIAADLPEEAAELLVKLREAARAANTHAGRPAGALPADGMTAAAALHDSCELGLLRLCRRYRTTRYGRDVQSLARASQSQRVRDEAFLVLRLVEKSPLERGEFSGSAYGLWRCFPEGAPPDAPGWPVDHLDEWEMDCLFERSSSYGVADGHRARGMAALSAGEIRLESERDRAAKLLRTAESAFRTAGDDVLADHAASIASHPDDRSFGRVHLNVSEATSQSAGTKPDAGRRYDLQRLARPLVPFALAVGLVPLFVGVDNTAVQVILVLMALAVAARVLVVPRSQRFGLGTVVAVRRRRRGTIELDTRATTMTLWPRWEEAGLLNRLSHSPTRSYEIIPLAPRRVGPHHLSSSLVISRSVFEPRGTLYPVGLLLSEELCYHEWERWIGLAKFRRTFVFRLVGGTRRLVPLDRWRKRTSVFEGPAELCPADADSDPTSSAERRLHYLVGTPVRTSAGVRMTVHGRTRRPTRHRGENDREEEAIGSLTTVPTSMLVVQAPPLEGEPRALGTAHADYLQCAIEATDGGVDSVLIIPPLPDNVAATVVQRIWHEIAGAAHEPLMADLFALVAEVRSVVADAEPSDQPVESRIRADLDVIFLHRPTS